MTLQELGTAVGIFVEDEILDLETDIETKQG